jgi:hypothetical protein
MSGVLVVTSVPAMIATTRVRIMRLAIVIAVRHLAAVVVHPIGRGVRCLAMVLVSVLLARLMAVRSVPHVFGLVVHCHGGASVFRPFVQLDA